LRRRGFESHSLLQLIPDTDLDRLIDEVLENPDARAAYVENALRRGISETIYAACEAQDMTLEALVDVMGTNKAQFLRLIRDELGGPLELGTICRAAIALGMSIKISLDPRR
jgi:hypothetical protein